MDTLSSLLGPRENVVYRVKQSQREIKTTPAKINLLPISITPSSDSQQHKSTPGTRQIEARKQSQPELHVALILPSTKLPCFNVDKRLHELRRELRYYRVPVGVQSSHVFGNPINQRLRAGFGQPELPTPGLHRGFRSDRPNPLIARIPSVACGVAHPP